MKKRYILGALLIVGIAVFAVVGSGNQKFIDDYNETTAPLRELSSELGSATAGAGSDPKAAAADMKRIGTEMAAVSDDLKELDPPSDAKDELDELVKQIDISAAKITEIGPQLEGDPTKALASLQELATAAGDLTKAENALKTAVDG